MLHDIKNRFFGNGLGYIMMILWPASHMAVVMLVFLFVGRAVPYGQSAMLYAATGVVPYIAWNYISRFTCLGVIQNKSFMAYPVIKPLDMMLARLALEIVSSYIITMVLLFILMLCQVPIVPVDIGTAVAGLLSAVFLGIGFGVFNTTICMITQFWQLVYVLVLIVAWLTCGLAINIEAMPERLGEILAWNPLVHSIEWVRLGFYADYPAHYLSRTYVLMCAAVSLVLGLIGERALRRFLL